ncbi:hypothetical protein R3P38DRAFT_3192863 [Favolaschia claudopus]|uniref:Uncharacterized protein n=1 Tax=Favolaschia claudopus TaxID=2862362 RepID=A0AAW0BIP9_9AGAR
MHPSSHSQLISRQPPAVVTHVVGAWNFATCFSLFFQGILYAHFAEYLHLSKRDSLRLKLFVGGLAFLTTLKSFHAVAILWIQNVVNVTDVEAVLRVRETAWVFHITLLLEAIGSTYVELFFCYRLWTISRDIHLVLICVVIFVFAFVAAIIATCFIFTKEAHSQLIWTWAMAHLGAMSAGDILLTASIITYLLREKYGSIPSRKQQSCSIIEFVGWLIMQSAAPATLCVLVEFSLTARLHSMELRKQFTGLKIGNTILNMLLPQIYAWLAMWSINSRERAFFEAETKRYTAASDLGTFVSVRPEMPKTEDSAEQVRGAEAHVGEANGKRNEESRIRTP